MLTLGDGTQVAYFATVPDQFLVRSEIIVVAGRDQTIHWEMNIRERGIREGDTHVEVEVPTGAFCAFVQMHSFFALLAEQEPTTLLQVTAILDALGAEDRSQVNKPGPR